jgi:hypothetical protein
MVLLVDKLVIQTNRTQ